MSMAGCGGSKAPAPSADSVEIDESKPYAGQTIKVLITNNGHFMAQKSRSEQFTEMTGINVEFATVAWGDLMSKIITEGIAGTGYYDVVWYLDAWAPALNTALYPLDGFVNKDSVDLNAWPKAYIDTCTYDGKLLGIPTRSHPALLFYRSDIFEDLGLEPPKTWADVEEAGSMIVDSTDLEGIAMYYGKGGEGQNLWNWFVFLWSNGSDLFDEDLKPIFNNKEGIEATQRYVDILLKHRIAAPGSASFIETEAINSFARGESAMWLGWWWAYSTFTNPDAAAPEVVDNVKFVSVPGWEGRGTANPIISVAMGITSSSKNKEAAWEFIKWANTPEVEKDIVVGTYRGTNPSDERNIVVSLWENLRDPEINELSGGLHELGAESLENAKALPKIIEWPEIVEVLSTAISDIAGGAPVKSTMDGAANSVESILDRAGYYK